MKLRHPAQLLIIALAVFIVFGQTMAHEFVGWDDADLITRNPYVVPLTAQNLFGAWLRPHTHLYIPLTYNLWALLGGAGQTTTPDAIGSTLNAYLFHSANVLLHCCCALVVLQILQLLLKRPWIATAGAVLWAIHPIQVEPVAWATGMKDVLSGLLALLSLWLYLIAATRPAATPRQNLARYLGAGLLLALASTAKPGVIGVPFFAIALDWLVLNRPLKRVALCALPMLIAAIPATIITAIAQPVIGLGGTRAQRPLIAGYSLAFYLRKLIWPDTFTIDYGLRPLRILSTTWVYYAWLIPAALTCIILASGKWRRPMLAAWLIFLAGVGPVLGLSPFIYQAFSTVCDRYVYLAMLGTAFAAAWLLQKLPTRYAIVIAVLALAALTMRSAVQAATWADTQTLMGHTLAANPDSFIARTVIAADLVVQAGQLRAQAQQGPPNDPDAIAAREKALLMENRAETLLREALQAWPDYPSALNDLGAIQLRHNQLADALDTLEHAVDALETAPVANAVVTMDRLTIAKAAYNLKRYRQSAEGARKYLARYPDSAEARELLNKAQAALDSTTAPTTQP